MPRKSSFQIFSHRRTCENSELVGEPVNILKFSFLKYIISFVCTTSADVCARNWTVDTKLGTQLLDTNHVMKRNLPF